MKIFLTHRSLTVGVIEVSGGISVTSTGAAVITMGTAVLTSVATGEQIDPQGARRWHVARRSWLDSLETALVRAEQLRQARLKSLLKQVKKLEAMKFNPRGKNA